MQQKNKALIKGKKSLLDTSALIAILKKEPGYEILEGVIANSAMSSVNLSELVSVLARSNIPDHEIDCIVTDIVPEIMPFSESLAIQAGKLIRYTKNFGLSLGDRACIATGIYHDMTIYTTDKLWQEFKSLANIVIVR